MFLYQTNEVQESKTRMGRPRKGRVNHKSVKAVHKEGPQVQAQVSDLTQKECTIVKESKCFLLRNLFRVCILFFVMSLYLFLICYYKIVTNSLLLQKYYVLMKKRNV